MTPKEIKLVYAIAEAMKLAKKHGESRQDGINVRWLFVVNLLFASLQKAEIEVSASTFYRACGEEV